MFNTDEKIRMLSGADFWHTAEVDGVPQLMLSDGPHGLRKHDENFDDNNVSITAVCFPTGSCIACSFDVDLMKRLGNILGEECCAENVDVLLGPGMNIKRSPLCGRNFEYFSEDPYLSGTMAMHYINGVQEKGVGACVKHFAVNSQEKRRHTISAEVDGRALREIYLKGFEIAIKGSQPKTVMCSYNKINGVSSSQNKWLLTDVLRGDWGFKGFVMSDWGAVKERYMGVKAGLDLEMPSSGGIGTRNIKKALEDGKVTLEEIDNCCDRIISVSKSMNPVDAEFDREEHHKLSKIIAQESMVILKNDNQILPLIKEQKIAFIGEFAEKPRFQGGGSSHINSYKVESAVQLCPDIPYAKGFSSTEDVSDYDLQEEALELAAAADVAVVFAGLPDIIESEAYDRKDMSLPSAQDRLIKRICAVQKNVVVVLHNGSPVEIPWINGVSGILEAYLGGEAAHEAVVDILFGEVNPSGKLAESFPKKLYHNSSYYNFPGQGTTVEYRESVFVGYRHLDDTPENILFPFGHGLSYTTFEYSNIEIDGMKLSFKIKNVGQREGKEVSQIYISNKDSKVFRPKKELKRFVKTHLMPNEEKEISVELSENDFKYYNIDRKDFVVEKGNYEILIGSSSRDIRLSAGISLDGIEDVPYNDEVNELYKTSDKRFITHSDFEKLLGRRIDISPLGKPYSIDCSIGDITETKIGKIANRIIDNMNSSDDKMGNPEVIKAFARETPIQNIATMSGGNVNEAMAEAICDLLNDRKIVKSLSTLAVHGIKNSLKNILNKEI